LSAPDDAVLMLHCAQQTLFAFVTRSPRPFL